MKFWMELNLPNYFGRDSLNLLHEREEISNFQTYIKGFESYIIKEFKSINQFCYYLKILLKHHY